MRVVKYLPDKLYGFCQGDTGEGEVFFHLAVFQPGGDIQPLHCPHCPEHLSCEQNVAAPPPILGEVVTVAYDPHPLGEDAKRAPRASYVQREHTPSRVLGVVESFDPVRRYGFALGDDQVSYHLHQCEIIDGKLPLMGDTVAFFPGLRAGRPRACHVKVCR